MSRPPQSTCAPQIFRPTSEVVESARYPGTSTDERNAASGYDLTCRTPVERSLCYDYNPTNVRQAATLISPPCELGCLVRAQHISAFLCSVAFGSACRKPVPTKAVGLLPGTSDPTQSVDRCCPTEPRLLVQVL